MRCGGVSRFGVGPEDQSELEAACAGSEGQIEELAEKRVDFTP